MTEAEIREALRQASTRHVTGDDGLTTEDLARMSGMSKDRVRVVLRRLMADGTVVVGHRPDVDLAGRPIRRAVYVFNTKETSSTC